MARAYEVRLTPNEVGGYDAFIPSIDMVTAGESVKDALAMAYDLIYTAVPAFLQEGRAILADSFEPLQDAIVGAVMVDCDADTPELETMTVQEAAGILGVSDSRIHAMIKAGILESMKKGTCRLVTTESVRRRFNSPQVAGRPQKELALA